MLSRQLAGEALKPFLKAEGLAHIDQLEALHDDTNRDDISKVLNLKSDVMDESLRTVEARNWINHLVLPNMRRC